MVHSHGRQDGARWDCGPRLHPKAAQQQQLVVRAVRACLDAELFDPRLDEVWLEGAFVCSGGFTLLFATEGALGDAREALEGAVPILRAAVARRSARKRVPRLTLEVMPASAFVANSA